MSDTGHGSVGTREQQFTSILPLSHPGYQVKMLFELSKQMKAEVDSAKDGPDPEENLWVPAGYTYFGQFIDHDLTFDSTSSLNPADNTGSGDRIPTNLRTPRFDLDCVYGDGPAAQPFMYGDDGATLLLGGPSVKQNDGTFTADGELLRAPNGRAIIGDKRNDENSIVCQIQIAFIKFHNAVVAKLAKAGPQTWTDPSSLFNSARDVVRWTYQRLLLEDFLPRIVRAEVLQDLAGASAYQRKNAYVLYTEDLRGNLPREFVAAAYRFGHSGVRPGYRLNEMRLLDIFAGSDKPGPDGDTLLGFDPLPIQHVIDDWGRFLPDTGPSPQTNEPRNKDTKATEKKIPKVRLQYAYKIDPTLVDNLGVLPVKDVAGPGTTQEAIAAIAPVGKKLPDADERPTAPRPSLALLNLLRGNVYRIQSGQAYADVLASKYTGRDFALKPDQLALRVPAGEGKFKFQPIDPAFQADTPLWFYILAEAQAPALDFLKTQADADGAFSEDAMLNGAGAETQLGWVGGRIVAEVFYGLIDSDPDSFVNKAPIGWTPPILNKQGLLLLKNLILQHLAP